MHKRVGSAMQTYATIRYIQGTRALRPNNYACPANKRIEGKSHGGHASEENEAEMQGLRCGVGDRMLSF